LGGSPPDPQENYGRDRVADWRTQPYRRGHVVVPTAALGRNRLVD
jgi:hypothetical protein